jgi:hypothetical protein
LSTLVIVGSCSSGSTAKNAEVTTTPSSDSPTTIRASAVVTPAAAADMALALARTNYQANATLDTPLLASAEDGPALEVDSFEYAVARTQGKTALGSDPPPPTDVKVVVPYQTAYPASFLYTVHYENPKKPVDTAVLVTVSGPASPPKVEAYAVLQGSTSLPPLALDADGYGSLVVGATAADTGLRFAPTDVASEFVSYLSANYNTASPAPSAVIAKLDERASSTHQGIVQEEGQGGVLDHFFTPGAFAPIAFRLADGGAVVFLTYNNNQVNKGRSGAIDLTAPYLTLSPGRYSEIDTRILVMTAVAVPAAGSSSLAHEVGVFADAVEVTTQ